MSSGGNFNDGFFQTRPVLKDISNNRPEKRPFSSISSDSPHPPAKQVCFGVVENLAKEKCKFRSGVEDSSLQNVSSHQSSLPIDGTLTEKNSFGFGEKGQGTLGLTSSGVSLSMPLIQEFINPACENSVERDPCVGKLASSKCGAMAMECSTISASQDSKFLGLQRCVGLKGDGGASSVVGGGDLPKDCSCSFCSTAAYIWSDLHYQDIKGRLSALKKSHKEASNFVQKFSGAKDSVTDDQKNYIESSKLELNLMDQWKSLFVHMENTFAHEISQLESSFETLKDLRENCKNDLELIDSSRLDNH